MDTAFLLESTGAAPRTEEPSVEEQTAALRELHGFLDQEWGRHGSVEPRCEHARAARSARRVPRAGRPQRRPRRRARDPRTHPQTGEHEKRAELLTFLTTFSGLSERLRVEERDAGLRGGASFALESSGDPTGIVFSGTPGGHEFNSFVLATLHAGGIPVKLDEAVVELVRRVDEPLAFETIVSLGCHNCPDIVQALHQFAVVNPLISSEMIDGGVYSNVVEERNVQGVPAVFLDGAPFANGKVDAAVLVEKLLERFPSLAEAEPRKSEPSDVQDVTVVGGGPAGVSAAIYAARKGFAVTLVADRFGGQVKDTIGIENLISIPTTTGSNVVKGLRAHLAENGVTLREHLRVRSLEPASDSDPLHSLTLASGEVLRSRSVIVATGAQWRKLGVPGEAELLGNGVAYCPHCDGPFFKGQDVAVIGGGNSGVEAALDLAGIVRHVTVFEFQPELKADQVLVEKARTRTNIDFVTYAGDARGPRSGGERLEPRLRGP